MKENKSKKAHRRPLQPCACVGCTLVCGLNGDTPDIPAYLDPHCVQVGGLTKQTLKDLYKVVINSKDLCLPGRPFQGLYDVYSTARNKYRLSKGAMDSKNLWLALIDTLKNTMEYPAANTLLDRCIMLGDAVNLLGDLTRLSPEGVAALYYGGDYTPGKELVTGVANVHRWYHALVSTYGYTVSGNPPRKFDAGQLAAIEPAIAGPLPVKADKPMTLYGPMGLTYVTDMAVTDPETAGMLHLATNVWIQFDKAGINVAKQISKRLEVAAENAAHDKKVRKTRDLLVCKRFLSAFMDLGRCPAYALADIMVAADMPKDVGSLGRFVKGLPVFIGEKLTAGKTVEEAEEAPKAEPQQEQPKQAVPVEVLPAEQPEYKLESTYTFKFPFRQELDQRQALKVLQLIGYAMPGQSNLCVKGGHLYIKMLVECLGNEEPKDFLLRVEKLIEGIIECVKS